MRRLRDAAVLGGSNYVASANIPKFQLQGENCGRFRFRFGIALEGRATSFG